jgi:putative ABC transport system permease protein
VEDLGDLEEVAAPLRAVLGPAYEVHTWQELQPFVRDVIRRQRFVLGLISAILFVIILTGIINTMLMSVFERVREIGTMLAVGVRRRQVLRLFLLEAMVLGVVGGVGGVALGAAIVGVLGAQGIPVENLGTAGTTFIRPELDLPFVGMAFAVAVVGAVLAAAWPAWKASQLNPVDALRAN